MIYSVTQDKNKEIEENKKKEYYIKQYQINRRKEEIDELTKIEQKEKQYYKEMKDKKMTETLKNNEEILNQRKSKILEKIHENEIKVQMVEKLKEQELMNKNEMNIIKSIDREENIKRLSRIQEYQRMKTRFKLEEKSKHFENFKQSFG